MTILKKLTTEQYQKFIYDYYNGAYPLGMPISEAFTRFAFQIDDPLLFELVDDQDVLDHIQNHYVEGM